MNSTTDVLHKLSVLNKAAQTLSNIESNDYAYSTTEGRKAANIAREAFSNAARQVEELGINVNKYLQDKNHLL